MLKICCLYFEGKYEPEYIGRLYRSLKRNCSIDFEFICYSDTLDVEADRVIPLPKDTEIQLHWHKLRFFDKDFIGEGDIIVLDIDQVVVNDITDMLSWKVKEKELVSYEKWWTVNPDGLPINGGWYKFKSGSLNFVWDKFNSNIDKWQRYYHDNGTVGFLFYGEQNFVYDTCIENDCTVTQMPGKWTAKYDTDVILNSKYNMWYAEKFDADFMIMGEEIWPELKIVHFANVGNNIHEHPDEWISKHWK